MIGSCGAGGFDRLSPNGVGFVFFLLEFPIILSPSFDRLRMIGSCGEGGFGRLSPNGVGVVFCLFEFPIILSLSKDKLSPNGEGGVATSENIKRFKPPPLIRNRAE
jgi:hypothetical protein